MADDIVARLRAPAVIEGEIWPPPALNREAADEVERLRAQNQELRVALSDAAVAIIQLGCKVGLDPVQRQIVERSQEILRPT